STMCAVTAPRFGLQMIAAFPRLSPPPRNAGMTVGGPPAVDGGGDVTTIIAQKTVGSFDTTVLKGGTSAEVAAWLDANGYATGPDAPSRLDSYVAKQFVFVAVKLTGGAGIDQIHPLVVRYQGTEPCVPL